MAAAGGRTALEQLPGIMADEAYIQSHGLEEKLSALVDGLIRAKPADPLAYLAEKLGGGAVGAAAAKNFLCKPSKVPSAPAPAPAPGADGKVCPCNLFGPITFGEPVVSKHDKTVHPPWYPAETGVDMGLAVHNTLTDTVVPFVPANGRRVLWYTCGPTVYDACHMVRYGVRFCGTQGIPGFQSLT